MAKAAILASGSGSNFQKIAERIAQEKQSGSSHEIALLVCDRPGALCLERASKLKIPSQCVVYEKGQREKAETAMTGHLERAGAELVVLAGFMRILSPTFVRRWKDRLINIHPALLPKHPGAHGIEDSFRSADKELGVTVHWVDEGVDTGPIITQKSFPRESDLTLELAEQRIHELEYELYPDVVLRLLNTIEEQRKG